MTTSQTLLKIAILAAGAIGRDLVPPAQSIVKVSTKKAVKTVTPKRWQDTKALDVLPDPKPKPKPKPKPAGPITMYDAVNIDGIPADAIAVAGYVNGRYANTGELRARFPHAKLLTIAVNTMADAECLDVETGDAMPAQTPGWVLRQHARGLARPCVYANRSTMPAVLGRARGPRDQTRPGPPLVRRLDQRGAHPHRLRRLPMARRCDRAVRRVSSPLRLLRLTAS